VRAKRMCCCVAARIGLSCSIANAVTYVLHLWQRMLAIFLDFLGSVVVGGDESR
jgi:hypothetical protein